MGLFTSNKKSWNFPSNNHGQIFGIADSGVETFNGTPIKSLAREICQNSIDANLKNGEPTRVEFSSFEIDGKDIPGQKELIDVLERCLSFWDLQKADKAKKFLKAALTEAQKKKITCLRISDFNTSGLTGSKEEYNSPWCNLTKSTGASDKSGTTGGSFGIGKFAPYACSNLRTVFYSTADSEGICASQGVARLTTFKDKNGETTQGTGYYGKQQNTPMNEQLFLDPNFSRRADNSGTDIYIIGFNGGKEWREEMIASILDGFLYAVYEGQLIADIDKVTVSKQTLPTLMQTYKPYLNEYADEYYLALTSDEKKSPLYTKEIEEPGMKGKLSLRLTIVPDMHRRVAMVRQTGMKIKDKGNINALIPFTGLLYIEGEELNGYLRNLENPQHLDWEPARADNQSQAKKLISSFTKFIKECLEDLKHDDGEEELDPSLGAFLSAVPEESTDQQQMTEAVVDTIKNIEIHKTKQVLKHEDELNNGSGKVAVDDPNGEIVVIDSSKDKDNSESSDGEHSGDNSNGERGNESGDNKTTHRVSLYAMQAAHSRVVCINKGSGEYLVTFTPIASTDVGVIDLYMSAESQNYDAQIKKVESTDFKGLTFEKNRIKGLSFEKGKTIRIKVTLNYHDYCSMEVKAYGNKI